VLDRLGEDARPVLPLMKRMLAKMNATDANKKTITASKRPAPNHTLKRLIDELEGRSQRLVYPTADKN